MNTHTYTVLHTPNTRITLKEHEPSMKNIIITDRIRPITISLVNENPEIIAEISK